MRPSCLLPTRLGGNVRSGGFIAPPFARSQRAYHDAKARVTTIDLKGEPVSEETEIRIGDAHEAYIYIEPEIGYATRSSIVQQLGGLKLTQDKVAKLPMKFNHGARHFSHEFLPFPRVEIDQDLPKQPGTMNGVTPATLWLSLNWHAITLNGSPEEKFEKMTRESADKLKGVLDLLKVSEGIKEVIDAFKFLRDVSASTPYHEKDKTY